MSTHPRLQTLIFEVTQRCNHACLHCYNVWNEGGHGEVYRPYPRGELDSGQTLWLLEKALAESDCRHVTLTGGEPLMREDLGQILDLLARKGARVTLISNGRLLADRTVGGLLDRGVSLFELPLLSYRREIHDHLSGAPGAFDAVLAAMSHVRYHHGEFVAVLVVTRYNLDDIYGTIKLAAAFGARGLMLNRFNPGGRGRAQLEALLPSAGELRRALAVADAGAAEFRLPISCSIPIQPCLVDTAAFANLSFGFCAAGSERAYYTLDPLGNLRPCNHSPTILGNLREDSLANLVAAPRLASFVAAIPEFCRACSLRETCQGGCKAAAHVCYGSLTAEDPFLHLNRALARMPAEL